MSGFGRIGASIGVLALLSLLACEDQGGDSRQQLAGPGAIVGGTKTGPQMWDGVVAFIGNNSLHCTGTLIHPSVVLTAGHCVHLVASGYNYRSNVDLLRLRVGANVGFSGALGRSLPDVAEAITHPEWGGVQNPDLGPGSKVDLALVRLAQPVKDLPTYCLREAPRMDTEETGVIVGYGLPHTNLGAMTGVRRFGETSIEEVWDFELKIGQPAGLCSGDSGGPMFTKVGDGWLLSAVASRGTAGCVTSAGAVMVDVAPRIEWIEGVLENWTGDSLGACTAQGPGGQVEDSDTGEDAPADTGQGGDSDPPVGADTQEVDSGDSDSWTGAPGDSDKAGDSDTRSPGAGGEDEGEGDEDTGGRDSQEEEGEKGAERDAGANGGCRFVPPRARSSSLARFMTLALSAW